MSSAKVDFASRASRLTSKSVLVTYEEGKRPDAPNTFASQYQSAAAPRKDSANVFTIDVMPNFIPILCQVFYHTNLYISKLEIAKHSKVSAATLSAYFMCIIYAHFLICDLTFRPVTSSFASVYDDSSYRQDFIEFMLTLPVPSFIETIIKRFMPTSTEKRKNIAFVPSFAGYSFYHHFGRLPPITFFTTIHDLIAETDSRATRNAIMETLFTTPLFTVDNFTTNRTSFSPSVANYVAAGYETATTVTSPPTTPGNHNARVYQLFSSLFSPSLFRDYTRRQHLASVSIIPQTYRAGSHNPYDFVFAASPANLGELRILFTSMSPLIKDNIPCSGNLASMYTTISGQSILKHGYSRYALPTWYSSTAGFSATGRGLTLVESTTFAARMNYRQTPAPTYAVTHTYPTATCSTDATHALTTHGFSWPWILLRNSARGTTEVPSPRSAFDTYNEERHLAPPVYVLDPIDASESDAWLVSALGMTIESDEFDGTVIPVPNTDLSLGIENTHFADSSIPYHAVFLATRFFAGNTRSFAVARSRVIAPRQSRFAAASLLVDRTQINLPRALLSTQDNLVNDTLPGMTIINSATWFSQLQSFIGFRTADLRSPTGDAISGNTNGLRMVFSPYTFTGVFDEENMPLTTGRPTANANNRTYFLTNLRTIFGTDIPLIETRHAYVCLPVF